MSNVRWQRVSTTNNKFTYKSNKPRVKYVLTELERTALKEIGRFAVKEARKRINIRSKTLWRGIGINIRRKEKSVRIGVKSKSKAFYGFFLEFGTKKMAKKPFLAPAIQENIPEIKAIVEKYVKLIEAEARATRVINEGELSE